MDCPPVPTPPTDELAERVLLVDDTPANLQVLFRTLEGRGLELLVARDGEEAIQVARVARPALVLLDIMMPGIDGFEVLRRLKADPATRDIAVIFMSALDDTAEKVRGLDMGAVDYITKPFQGEEVMARVDTHLRLHRLERCLAASNAALRELNRDLERKVAERTGEVLRSRDAVIFGLAKLAESRDDDTGQHLERICRYVEILVRHLVERDPSLDDAWVETMRSTAALHDIGKVGIPDAVLLKPGKLTDEEFATIRKHTTIGGDTLLAIKRRWEDSTFLVTATEIAFGHHERWDGSGYPFGLAGDNIPFAARVVAVADVYDALTSRRPYKEPFSHEKARSIIVEGSGSHFDPAMVEAFLTVQSLFAQVAREMQSG